MNRVLALVLLLTTTPALAVQPTLMTREDPITGGVCQQWSESDAYGGMSPPDAAALGVPWQYARLDSLWVCPSGYASFVAHFDRLTTAEQERIAEFLGRHRFSDLLSNTRNDSQFGIWLAEQVYALRDLDAAERALVQRALLYQRHILMGRALNEAAYTASEFEYRDGMDPEAYAATVFHHAVQLCMEGDVDAAQALLDTVDEDDLLAAGLELRYACNRQELAPSPEPE